MRRQITAVFIFLASVAGTTAAFADTLDDFDSHGQYYELKKDIYLRIKDPRPGDPTALKLNAGQVVAFNPATGAIRVQAYDGHPLQANIIIEAPQKTLADYVYTHDSRSSATTADWLEPSAKTTDGRGQNVMSFVQDPLELTKSTGAPAIAVSIMASASAGRHRVFIKSSKVVAQGYGDHVTYQLAQNICYYDFKNQQKCGYTTAADVRVDGHPAPSAVIDVPVKKMKALTGKAWDDHQAEDDRREAAEAAAQQKFLDQNPEMPTLPDDPAAADLLKNCPRQTGAAAQTTELLKSLESDAALKQLDDKVGLCVATPDQVDKALNGRSRQNIYDRFAIDAKDHPMMSAYRELKGKIKKSNGTSMNDQDFLSMDALARTIYGEMTSCAERDGHGRVTSIRPAPLAYKEAVACVIMERAKEGANDAASDGHEPRFIGGVQSPARTGFVSRAALAYKQFSVWNYAPPSKSKSREAQYKKTASSLLNGVLCPKQDTPAWAEARNVAMEFILDRAGMEKKCKDIHTPYYTSYVDMPKNAFWKWQERRPPPKIDGQSLSDKSCIRFWDQK